MLAVHCTVRPTLEGYINKQRTHGIRMYTLTLHNIQRKEAVDEMADQISVSSGGSAGEEIPFQASYLFQW